MWCLHSPCAPAGIVPMKPSVAGLSTSILPPRAGRICSEDQLFFV